MTLVESRHGVTPDYFAEADPLSTATERTGVLGADNPILFYVMHGIDQIFVERLAAGASIETSRRVTRFIIGEDHKAFLWRGVGLPGFAMPIVEPEPWRVAPLA